MYDSKPKTLEDKIYKLMGTPFTNTSTPRNECQFMLFQERE